MPNSGSSRRVWPWSGHAAAPGGNRRRQLGQRRRFICRCVSMSEMKQECQTRGLPGGCALSLSLLFLAFCPSLARAQGAGERAGGAATTASAATVELQRGERALSRGDAAAAIPSLEMAYLLR